MLTIQNKINKIVCFALAVLLVIFALLSSGLVYAAVSNTKTTKHHEDDNIIYPSVIRKDHVFMGWTDTATGQIYNEITMPGHSLSLKAQWLYAPLAAAYDKASVLSDLQNMSAAGERLSLADYPLDAEGDLQILAFIEWAYSPLPQEADNFALYLYIYNPTGADIDINSPSNRVSMASQYDAEGAPINYDKYQLHICSKSADNRFLKARIIDAEHDGQTIAQRISAEARRYDVAGIELYTRGANNPTDYGAGGTYIFTGYGAGMNNNSASTLACSVTELETVKLEVNSTFWRPDDVGENIYERNQLDAVYFGVPNELIATYGALQKIKAEWYDYRTNGMLVVNDTAAYNLLLSLRGTPYASSIYGVRQLDGTIALWRWGSGAPYWQDIITTVFYRSDLEAHVTAEELEEYLLAYNLSFNGGTLPINEGNISADLFNLQHAIYGPVTGNGYTVMEIDAGDEYNLLSAGDNAFRQWLLRFLRYDAHSTYGIEAIYAVQDTDLLGTDEEISLRLYIDVADVAAFKTAYNDNKAANKTTYLFRFAQSVYTAYSGLIIEKNGWEEYNLQGWFGGPDAYVAFETVYLNFDIIQLTFNREGAYKVIPVVSNPINILSDVEPPIEPEIDLWAWLKELWAQVWAWIKGLFSDWKAWAVLAAVVVVIIAGIVISRRRRAGNTYYVTKNYTAAAATRKRQYKAAKSKKGKK